MPDAALKSSLLTPQLMLAGAVVCLLVGATLALWAHYGTAVFFEVIAAGIAACF